MKKRSGLFPQVQVDETASGAVSQAGAVVLVETARASGLDRSLSAALAPWRAPTAVLDPGKILIDVAVSLAAGGDCLADVAVFRGAPEVFGRVASDPTVSRLFATLAADAPKALSAIRAARAAARARAWTLAGAHAPDHDTSASQPLVIDLDATLVRAHSEKEQARPTDKRGYGFHPLWAFLDHGPDGTGEALAVKLHPGNAGSNTAADHIEVTRQALKQLPEHEAGRRPGRKVLIRTVPRKRGCPQEPGRVTPTWPGWPPSGCPTPPEGVPPHRVRPPARHRRPVEADPEARVGTGLRRRRRGP